MTAPTRCTYRDAQRAWLRVCTVEAACTGVGPDAERAALEAAIRNYMDILKAVFPDVFEFVDKTKRSGAP